MWKASRSRLLSRRRMPSRMGRLGYRGMKSMGRKYSRAGRIKAKYRAMRSRRLSRRPYRKAIRRSTRVLRRIQRAVVNVKQVYYQSVDLLSYDEKTGKEKSIPLATGITNNHNVSPNKLEAKRTKYQLLDFEFVRYMGMSLAHKQIAVRIHVLGPGMKTTIQEPVRDAEGRIVVTHPEDVAHGPYGPPLPPLDYKDIKWAEGHNGRASLFYVPFDYIQGSFYDGDTPSFKDVIGSKSISTGRRGTLLKRWRNPNRNRWIRCPIGTIFNVDMNEPKLLKDQFNTHVNLCTAFLPRTSAGFGLDQNDSFSICATNYEADDLSHFEGLRRVRLSWELHWNYYFEVLARDVNIKYN
ncbi:capsid protein [Chifec virus UA13_72]|nr:capsid protein [Chifec virus UA13_72]